MFGKPRLALHRKSGHLSLGLLAGFEKQFKVAVSDVKEPAQGIEISPEACWNINVGFVVEIVRDVRPRIHQNGSNLNFKWHACDLVVPRSFVLFPHLGDEVDRHITKRADLRAFNLVILG